MPKRQPRQPSAPTNVKRRKPRREPPGRSRVQIDPDELIQLHADQLNFMRGDPPAPPNYGLSRSIDLARLRDDYERLTGRSAGELVRFADIPIPVPVIPEPGPEVEAVRKSGALAKASYNEHGVLRPITWRWVLEAMQVLTYGEIAEAQARAGLARARDEEERLTAMDNIAILRGEIDAATRKRLTERRVDPDDRRRKLEKAARDLCRDAKRGLPSYRPSEPPSA